MDVKVNLLVPKALYNESHTLVKRGIYSNYSELVRQAIRSEVRMYKQMSFTEDEKKLLSLLKRAKEEGQLLSEEEMAEYGLKV